MAHLIHWLDNANPSLPIDAFAAAYGSQCEELEEMRAQVEDRDLWVYLDPYTVANKGPQPLFWAGSEEDARMFAAEIPPEMQTSASVTLSSAAWDKFAELVGDGMPTHAELEAMEPGVAEVGPHGICVETGPCPDEDKVRDGHGGWIDPATGQPCPAPKTARMP